MENHGEIHSFWEVPETETMLFLWISMIFQDESFKEKHKQVLKMDLPMSWRCGDQKFPGKLTIPDRSKYVLEAERVIFNQFW